MYIIKVDGMKVKACRSFSEAKREAIKLKGKVYDYHLVKLPKSAMISYNDCAAKKKEIYREIYSTNHGYHLVGKRA